MVERERFACDAGIHRPPVADPRCRGAVVGAVVGDQTRDGQGFGADVGHIGHGSNVQRVVAYIRTPQRQAIERHGFACGGVLVAERGPCVADRHTVCAHKAIEHASVQDDGRVAAVVHLVAGVEAQQSQRLLGDDTIVARDAGGTAHDHVVVDGSSAQLQIGQGVRLARARTGRAETAGARHIDRVAAHDARGRNPADGTHGDVHPVHVGGPVIHLADAARSRHCHLPLVDGGGGPRLVGDGVVADVRAAVGAR